MIRQSNKYWFSESDAGKYLIQFAQVNHVCPICNNEIQHGWANHKSTCFIWDKVQTIEEKSMPRMNVPNDPARTYITSPLSVSEKKLQEILLSVTRQISDLVKVSIILNRKVDILYKEFLERNGIKDDNSNSTNSNRSSLANHYDEYAKKLKHKISDIKDWLRTR